MNKRLKRNLEGLMFPLAYAVFGACAILSAKSCEYAPKKEPLKVQSQKVVLPPKVFHQERSL